VKETEAYEGKLDGAAVASRGRFVAGGPQRHVGVDLRLVGGCGHVGVVYV
jgi:hypothetical protein